MNDTELTRRDLGDGLIFRRATRQDAEALADFCARVHSEEGWEQPDERVGTWTRDLLTLPHPTLTPQDFTIVEEVTSGKIISTLNLISQIWSYAGITFGVGRPELVGTFPGYRKRGLVRLQFDEIHRWSAARGEMLQAITGIPYYYRQFGYEMAFDLGGSRVGYRINLKNLAEGQAEPYIIRPARESDLPFIAGLYEQACRRQRMWCPRDLALWRWELSGKSDLNLNRVVLNVIETPQGELVGLLGHAPFNWGAALSAGLYEIKPGVPYSAVNPSVERYLYATGDAFALRDRQPSPIIGAISFQLGSDHPVYQTMHNALPRRRPPYAWFMRVPDLAGFVRHIAPALESFLAVSPYSGYSGDLKLSFYRRGLRLVLQAGRLAEVEAWQPTPFGHSGDAGFPDLTFLQLLFGYRSLDELLYAFADCFYENDDSYGLLNALFPKQSSDLWMIS
jgi:hypothetical protein